MNSDLPESHNFISFRNVMLVRILAGYYNDFFRRKSFRVFAKLYCIILLIVVTTITTNMIHISFWPVVITLVHWNFSVLVSLVTGDQYFLRFCGAIKLLDARMKRRHLVINRPVSRIIFLLITILKSTLLTIVTAAFIIGHLPYRLWDFFFTVAFIWASLNISHVLHIYIFEIASHRIKMLRDSLESTFKKPCHRSQDRVTLKINAIKECMAVYKCIFEDTKATFTPVKVLVVVSLICSFGKVMFYCYDIIKRLDLYPVLVLNIIIVECILACLMICLPVIFSDQAAHEVNNMKIVICEQLLICEDDRLRNVVEDALAYLTTYPFRVTIMRAINYDLSLPIALVSLCVTYLIVIIQMFKM